MPSPKKGYEWAGEKYPGTTTIIGRWKDSGGLLQWAFKQGQSGARTLYEQAEKAADIGTLAHAMVERWINGEDYELALKGADETSADKARNAFDQFLQWASETKVELLSKYQELQLVCPEYKFGGTPDAIGRIDGKVVLLDWKSSNGVYSDYIVQLAAYRHLIERGIRMDNGESLGLDVSDARLLRFSKDYPDFEYRRFGDLTSAWRQFQLFREAYDIDKELKKRAA